MSEALEITKADFDANKEDYLDRVENGEIIIVRHPDGRAVLALSLIHISEPTRPY